MASDVGDRSQDWRALGDDSSDDQGLRARLSSIAYAVTQLKATEPPYSGDLWNNEAAGVYRCVVCDAPLFHSDLKKPSDGPRIPGLAGWPSFLGPIGQDAVTLTRDQSGGMDRIAISCASCGAHLGHTFALASRADRFDHYCTNSAALRFEAAGATEQDSTPDE